MNSWRLANVVGEHVDWQHAVEVGETVWHLRGLGPRQQQLLRLLKRHSDTRGQAPTMRQMADELGLGSVSTVAYHLQVLQDRGWLRRRPGRHAALRLIAPRDLRVICAPLMMD